MAGFQINESQGLDLHRALLDRLAGDGVLLTRAREMLAIMRRGRGVAPHVWDAWDGILALDPADMASRLLADTPDQGLLRAHSPLVAALDKAGRNRLWQVVGMARFAGHVLAAGQALGLDADDVEAVVGVDADTLEAWCTRPPEDVDDALMQRLKNMVGIAHALETLFAAEVVRRGWLRTHCGDLGAVPLDLMRADIPADGLMRVHVHLSEAAHGHVGNDDRPRMG